MPNTMVEIWQANATGRYDHPADQHDAPLDPNFHGAGRVFTDEHGRYRFLTIRPGAYPWPNHRNAWRPNHIHFSYFGPAFATRLVTQMSFPGDPLLAFDPIFHAVPDEHARNRLIAAVRSRHHRAGLRAGASLRRRAARSRCHADGALSDAERDRQPDHRAVLAPARGSVLGRPDAVWRAGRADHADRRGAGWRRQSLLGCLRRDLAVRSALVGQFSGFRTEQHRRAGAVPVHHGEAGARCPDAAIRSRRRTSQSASSRAG